jgi:hypothetical protein
MAVGLHPQFVILWVYETLRILHIAGNTSEMDHGE